MHSRLPATMSTGPPQSCSLILRFGSSGGAGASLAAGSMRALQPAASTTSRTAASFLFLFMALPSGSVGAAAPALRKLRLQRLAAGRAAPGRAIGPPLEAKDTRSALGVQGEHPQLGLALGRRQLAHRRGEHLVLHHRPDALALQDIFGMVHGGQVERAVDPLQGWGRRREMRTAAGGCES